MAGSKKKKIVKQREMPKGNSIAQGGDPERYYSEKPSWAFSASDQEMWQFSKTNADEAFWSEILPRLKGLETQTWGEILLHSKKQNHSIDLQSLNKIAQDRHYKLNQFLFMRLFVYEHYPPHRHYMFRQSRCA